MQVIKLSATDSTNSFLKRLIREHNVKDNTVVTAEYQTRGRGQMGGNWASEPGENLMFSVFRTISGLDNNKQFYISIVVSLAIYNILKNIGIPKLAIKWPNDILSEKKKICGILIENKIKNTKITATVIGVGINVNQQDFSDLPRASSLKNITGITYNTDELLQDILKELDMYMQLLKEKKFQALKTAYEACLFGIRKPLTFKAKNEKLFTGLIKGVTDKGRLIVLREDETQKTFDLKAIEMLY